MKSFIAIFVVVLAVVGFGFYLFQASEAPDPSTLPGVGYENQGAEHITDGVTEHAAYNSNPPTSGPHWPVAAPWGAYDSADKDERYVHNLEHGGIWITYKPGLPADQISALKDFAKRYRKIIVTPREANETNIALAAWTRLDTMDAYDEARTVKFIEALYDQGPEKVP